MAYYSLPLFKTPEEPQNTWICYVCNSVKFMIFDVDNVKVMNKYKL